MQPKVKDFILSIILFFAIVFYGMQKAYAQVPQYYASAGTGSNGFPFGTSDKRVQLFYTPADFQVLPTSGQITKIYFRPSTAGSAPTYTNFSISMGNTSITGLTTTYATGLTNLIPPGPFSLPAVVAGASGGNDGWVGITLPAMFNYTGQNLIVEVIQLTVASGFSVRNKTVTGGACRLFAASTATTGSVDDYKYDFGFDMVTCTAPTGLAAGGVTSSSANLSWGAVTGSLGYEYVISTSATAPTGAGTTIAGTSFTENGLNFGTTYYLHVRNKCASSFSTWSTLPFSTLPNPCITPSGINASNITLTSADLSWTAVTGSTGYEYIVDQVPTVPLVAGTPIAGTSFTAAGLNSSSTYYLHLRNVCSPTSKSNWANYPFTTLTCPMPSNIIVNTPTASSATFTWTGVPGSIGYQYAITSTTAAPTTGITSTTNTNGTVTGLVPSSTYYIQIRNNCAAGSWSAWTVLQFVMPTCDAPVNIISSNITHNDADLIWSVMPGAHHYEWIVDLSPADPFAPTGANSTTNMAAHVAGLTPYTKYYVHIRSVCFIDDRSAWALDSFETSPFCPAPNVMVANPNTNNLVVSWDPVTTALAYDFAVNKNETHPAFGTHLEANTMNVSLPPDGMDYYAHVRAKCNGQFIFSEWTTVTLRKISTNAGNIQKDHFINVYPNPVKNKLVIEVSSVNFAGYVTLTDVTGRVLYKAEVNKSKTEVDISAIPQGLYLLHYTDNATIDHKVKITKE